MAASYALWQQKVKPTLREIHQQRAFATGRNDVAGSPGPAARPADSETTMTTSPNVLWTKTPQPGQYINSVAVSADGGVVVAGTWFHSYSSDSNAASKQAVRVAQAQAPTDPPPPTEYQTFGTYAWNTAGDLIFSNTFSGWQGVYWVDVSADGSTAASCGWYSGAPSYQGFIAAFDVASGNSELLFMLNARGNVVALDANGALLLAGADQGYLFSRSSSGSFNTTPATISLTASGDSVMVSALDANGDVGLIASYQGEVILFSISAGVPGTPVRWQLPNSAYLHAAALSSDGTHVYVGANDGIQYSILVSRFMSDPVPMWSAALPSGGKVIYGVACSSNGGVSAVAGNTSAGGVVAYYADKYNNGAMYWQATTLHSPNSVSMDAGGAWVALADGHPDGTPGCFYLWQSMTGALLWSYPTPDNMSWPIVIAADASLVVGGSDDGTVYAFSGPAA